jgi:hypothetical protein
MLLFPISKKNRPTNVERFGYKKMLNYFQPQMIAPIMVMETIQ